MDGEGAGYTITADLDEAVRRVIKAIPEAGWDVFRDRDGFQTGREVSETVHTMNDSGHAFRLVAWREQVEDPSLFATPDEDFYRYRAVIINVSEKEMSVEEVLPSGWTCQTIQTLRQKALRLVGKATKSARQLTLKIRTSADQLSQLRTARRLIYHLD